MKKNLFLTLIFSIAISSCTTKNYRKILKEDYSSKMTAAWIGQMIGVGWSAPTEFRFIGEIIPDKEIPEFDGNDVNAFDQDDIYVEMTFLKTLEDYGIDCSIRQAGIDFANSEYMLWGANNIARENLRFGIAPPESSHPEYHKGGDWIDYQIEADFSGIICPGMPNEVIALGEKFGRLMNYGDGFYAGQFIGGMYAAAYFETDINKIVEAGLSCIPEQSQYAECIRDVMEWHKEEPVNWEKTWQLIENKYRNNPDYQKYKEVNDHYWVDMDAKLNAAYIVMGLLYGNGDPDKTILISMKCGRDSDCNPSNAAGVLFTSIGLNGLDKKYYEKLSYDTKFAFTSYNFTELIEVCTRLAEQFILKSGGKIEKESDGKTYYYIPEKPIVTSVFEQSWAPGPFDANNRFTEEELAHIDYFSTKQYDKYLNEWMPETWKVYYSARNDKDIATTWKGKEGVVVTYMLNEKRGAMVSFDNFLENEGKNFFLEFSVSHEDGGSWDLSVNINEDEWLKENINSESCFNGWKDYKIDISEFAGTDIVVELKHEFSGNENSAAYWHDVKIIN